MEIIIMHINFTINGTPVGKQRPKFARRGAFVKTYTPEKTVNYEGRVAYEAKQAIIKCPDWDFEAAYNVTIMVSVAIPSSWSKRRQSEAAAGNFLPTKMPDIDNLIKSLFDGMNGVVWKDDKQVTSVVAAKKYSQMPMVCVSVQKIGRAAP